MLLLNWLHVFQGNKVITYHFFYNKIKTKSRWKNVYFEKNSSSQFIKFAGKFNKQDFLKFFTTVLNIGFFFSRTVRLRLQANVWLGSTRDWVPQLPSQKKCKWQSFGRANKGEPQSRIVNILLNYNKQHFSTINYFKWNKTFQCQWS